MVLERQIFLQKEGGYSVQHVLHYPTVPMKVKTPALIAGGGGVDLGCLSILFKLNGDRTNIDSLSVILKQLVNYAVARTTVVPTKSDSDVIFCFQLLSSTLICTLHLS